MIYVDEKLHNFAKNFFKADKLKGGHVSPNPVTKDGRHVMTNKVRVVQSLGRMSSIRFNSIILEQIHADAHISDVVSSQKLSSERKLYIFDFHIFVEISLQIIIIHIKKAWR